MGASIAVEGRSVAKFSREEPMEGQQCIACLAKRLPIVKWRYDWKPETDSPEALLYQMLPPRDWLETRTDQRSTAHVLEEWRKQALSGQ